MIESTNKQKVYNMADCSDLITLDDQRNAKLDTASSSEYVSSDNPTLTTRLGKVKKTVQGMNDDAQTALDNFEDAAGVALAAAGYPIIGDFSDVVKVEITDPNQVYSSKSIVNFEDGLYRYLGALPYTPTETEPNSNWASVALGELKSAALAVGTNYLNIMYDTDLTTPIVGYIFVLSSQQTYSVPSGAQGKTILTVVGDLLTTTDLVEYTLETAEKSALELTTAEAVALTTLKLGDVVKASDRGNGEFKVVLASTVTPNTYDIIACIGKPHLALKLRIGSTIFMSQIGATGGYNADTETGSDDTGAFKRARDIFKATTFSLNVGSNPMGGVDIVCEQGSYLITEAGALMDKAFTTRVFMMNVRFLSGCQITYKTTATASDDDGLNALWQMNDSVLGLIVEGGEFYLPNEFDDYWWSASAGGTQDITHNNVYWRGTFRKGFDIAGGGNNNSEYKWNGGGITGGARMEQFLDIRSSDQNLNYSFNNGFKFWAARGQWIRAQLGGAIKIAPSCDISGHTPVADTYLFELLGTTHARGVTSFVADGLRTEQKSEFSKLLYCEWPFGIVSLRNLDQGSQASFVPSTSEQVVFNLGNNTGPAISFDNAQLIGTHTYTFGSNQWEQQNSISYKGIHHAQLDDPSDFLTVTGTNNGGRPAINFSGGCKGNVGYSGAGNKRYVWDQLVGGYSSSDAFEAVKTVSLKTAGGQLPASGGETLAVVLPENSIIISMEIYSTNAATDTSAYDYQLRNADDTVIASVSGASLSTGVRETVEVNDYKCDTTNNREIRLVDNGPVIQSISTSFVKVSYIGF